MAIIIPEKIIKEELEVFLKYYYTDLVARQAAGTVTDAADENAGVTPTISQQGAAGVSEITSVVCPADVSGSLSGTYWYINTPVQQYYVWYNVDGNSIDPAPSPIKTGIMVAISTDDIADDVATATAAAIDANADFTCPIPTDDTIVVTCTVTSQETLSQLWQIFGGVKFDNMDYFKQASDILKRRYTTETRRLNIVLGYSSKRETPFTISILLPTEENNPKQTGVVGGRLQLSNGESALEKMHAFQCTYHLLITSDNQNEVVIMYHFLKTLLLQGLEHLSHLGFENIWVSGQDVTMSFELAPMSLYHKTVALSFFYQNLVPEFQRTAPATGATFTGTLKASI